MKNLAVIFTTLVLLSCTASRKQETSASSSDPDSLFAYIERTYCFGICPVYSIHIYRSGYVLYEGKNHVPNIGRFFTRLPKEDLKSIGEKAEAIGYFDLKDEYRNPYLTDFPTVYTEVRYNGKVKKVTHYDAEPPANLVEMEKYIDSFFTTETRWQIHPVQEYKD